LAMRLVGASFVGASGDVHDFDGIVLEAVRQLNGEGLSKSEAEAQRDALIQGYRWILVDEYQDIGPEEYALIAAVAGRSLDDPDLRLSLFAVGDDDQNIYAFAGASIRFIRQFEADYKAKPEFLTDNYRSTRHIIDAANSVIAPAAERMKIGHDITINQKRERDPPGGAMEEHDPVAAGRVELLHCPPGDIAQAVAAVDQLVRLSRVDPQWNWSRAAIISRDWRRLAPVRAYAEAQGIPVEMANESLPNIWRLREMQAFIGHIRRDPTRLLDVTDLLEILNSLHGNRWTDLIAEGIAALAREIARKAIPVPDLIEWFAEWSRDTRGEQRGLLLLTAHRAKGLEFDYVVILDGGWEHPSPGEDADAPRRLFYVAMTRARRNLAVMANGTHPFLTARQEAVLERKFAPGPGGLTGCPPQYATPDLKLVDLSWAGRLKEGHPALAAIEVARVGDPVTLAAEGSVWTIRNAKGQALGRMARAYAPPKGLDFLRGEIGAIVRWRKSDNKEEFRSSIRRDEWEAILPELVFS
jgi:ATP-dependent DNA helicase RecQ